jgi:rubredoxin-NAD+ reductase
LTIIAGDAADAYAKPMLSNAIALGYGKLVLALGADPIRVPVAGDAASEVLSVNHIDDYTKLRALLDQAGPGARVTIMGAGLIGCEFADDLLSGGHHVTLVDPNRLPLAALAAPSLSAGLAKAWSGRDVTLCLGTTVASVERAQRGYLVTLADGGKVEADLVLSAVGLRPSIALAQSAGLLTRRGILVDAHGLTSAPDVYALGDCAEYATALGSAVLPYVAPMLAAARAIAASLAGTPTAIIHKNEAVIVKTPSYKLALAPPPAGMTGVWVDEHDGERTIARFMDAEGKLHGFGVSAHTPALRQKLQGELHWPT